MKVRDLAIGSVVEQPGIASICMSTHRFEVLAHSNIYSAGNGHRSSYFIRLKIRNTATNVVAVHPYLADAPVYTDKSVGGGLLLIDTRTA